MLKTTNIEFGGGDYLTAEKPRATGGEVVDLTNVQGREVGAMPLGKLCVQWEKNGECENKY